MLYSLDIDSVDTGKTWIEMKVKRSMEGYYLGSDKISLYPIMIYARLTIEENNENGET